MRPRNVSVRMIAVIKFFSRYETYHIVDGNRLRDVGVLEIIPSGH
jgi:hypothetical protein